MKKNFKYNKLHKKEEENICIAYHIRHLTR